MCAASAYDVVKAVLAADADDVVDAWRERKRLKASGHLPEFRLDLGGVQTHEAIF